MNCKCCGAPLHGSKCDYCGTTYEEFNPITHFQIDTYTHPVDTLTCRTNLPVEYLKTDNKELIERKVKEDMAYQMSEKLLDYMDIETWLDPATLTQCFGGRVRVARPY